MTVPCVEITPIQATTEYLSARRAAPLPQLAHKLDAKSRYNPNIGLDHDEWSCRMRHPSGVRAQISVNHPVRDGAGPESA